MYLRYIQWRKYVRRASWSSGIMDLILIRQRGVEQALTIPGKADPTV